MHRECALLGDLPEAKYICLLCKEDQHLPVSQQHTTEIQTREVSEEAKGHVNLVEVTIQTDEDMAAEVQIDLSEVAPGQVEVATDKETPVDLGKLE